MEIRKISVPKIKNEKKTTSEKIDKTFEEGCKDFMSDINANLRKQTLAEQKKSVDKLDGGYYFVTYFADREQRDDFLKKANVLDKLQCYHINGEQLAKGLNIQIQNKKARDYKPFRKHKNLSDFTI